MINTKEFPTTPGCYIFMDSRNAVIYIGKAKDLKKRVSSYLPPMSQHGRTPGGVKHNHDAKTKARLLLKQIRD